MKKSIFSEIPIFFDENDLIFEKIPSFQGLSPKKDRKIKHNRKWIRDPSKNLEIQNSFSCFQFNPEYRKVVREP